MSELLGEFNIDDTSGVPIWMQIRRRIAYLIVSGRYAAGDPLPTVRELAADLGVNYNTVSKVYQDLARDGLAVNCRGKCVTVAKIDNADLGEIDAEIAMLANELIEKAREAGMSGEDILDYIKGRIDASS